MWLIGSGLYLKLSLRVISPFKPKTLKSLNLLHILIIMNVGAWLRITHFQENVLVIYIPFYPTRVNLSVHIYFHKYGGSISFRVSSQFDFVAVCYWQTTSINGLEFAYHLIDFLFYMQFKQE